eukprot:scaffold21079_cov60-Phaeocystis_antarctica.AAC.2
MRAVRTEGAGQLAPYCTYSVHVPASGVPYVPRTVWCTTGEECSEAKAAKAAAAEPLPSTLLPITLSVFAQMLGEGIAISSLPLYMTNLGASPMQVGLAT